MSDLLHFSLHLHFDRWIFYFYFHVLILLSAHLLYVHNFLPTFQKKNLQLQLLFSSGSLQWSVA